MRMKDRCEVILDMGGGYGGSTRDHLKQTMSPTLFLGSESADGIRDRTGVLRFLNMRAAAHWSFRDALDPDYGSNIALPPDPYLKQELMAIRWRMATGGKVAIEPKEETKARIGRSPDRCDAVVMAWHARGATNHQRGVIGSQSTRSITSGRNPNRRR